MNTLATLQFFLLLLLAGMMGAASPARAQAQKADAATTTAAPAETLRPEVAKLLVAAQEKIKARQFSDAMQKFTDVDLVANKTPYEIFVMERMRGTSALALNEHATAAKSFQTIIASGRLNASDRLLYTEAVTGAHYQLKDYKLAADWAARALKEGSTQPQTRILLIQSLYLADDFARAKTEIDTAIAIEDKAGRTMSEELLKMQGRTALKLNDTNAYLGALEKLVIHYPGKLYWADFIARLAGRPGISDRYIQDVFRLQLALGETLTGAQYLFLAQNAMQAGFPIDARQLLDKGVAAGVMGNGAEFRQLRDKAAKDADDDMKNIARSAADAEKGRDGPGLFNAGLNHVINGDKEKGIAMMEQGIKRPGLRRPEDFRLRLAITYAMSGESAKAAEMLAAITGPDGLAEVARLWAAYAKQAKQAKQAKPVTAAQ